jgi:hypothetical protein
MKARTHVGQHAGHSSTIDVFVYTRSNKKRKYRSAEGRSASYAGHRVSPKQYTLFKEHFQ